MLLKGPTFIHTLVWFKYSIQANNQVMEIKDMIKDFMGSPVFSVIMLVAVLIVGIVLKLTFRSVDSEYKHNPDE